MDNRELAAQVVFYLGLAELVESRLAVSDDYKYAVNALNTCWDWIEHKNVPAATIMDLFHDDDDFGVEASMGVEHDPLLWNTWVCVAIAVAVTARVAYQQEGAHALPADLEGVGTSDTRDQFASSFRVLIPIDTVTEQYSVVVGDLPELATRSTARDLAFSVLHEAAVEFKSSAQTGAQES